MSTIRTRIAPSPTGFLHIGTARTALFNYLFAKKHGDAFVLRVEDTDLERSDPKYEAEILESLKWLGVTYDEGPANAALGSQLSASNYVGEYGPYRQSERIESYRKYLDKLLNDGTAFYCFHTELELEAERERKLTEKAPPMHICEYRGLDSKEVNKFLKEKPEHIIRFKTPTGRVLKFNDLIRGEISFDSDLLGDFSLAKDLNVPLYNFAVVIDDFEMKISHVIRGEDHISNTPKQILIQEALGFYRPEYAHLPLILGPDRSKLSKRHGATSISEYRSDGYLPEAVVNFMALLGWNPGTDQEVFTLEELIHVFDISKIQKSGAVFNVEKLDWLNGVYIRKKTSIGLTEACRSYLEDFLQFSIPNDQFSMDYVEKVVWLEQPRLKKLSEIGDRTEYFFRAPEYPKEMLQWKDMTDQEILNSLEQAEKIISNFKAQISKREVETAFLNEISGGDKGRILWPLRVALTGKKASPGPFEIMEILGSEEVLTRIKRAKDLLLGAK